MIEYEWVEVFGLARYRRFKNEKYRKTLRFFPNHLFIKIQICTEGESLIDCKRDKEPFVMCKICGDLKEHYAKGMCKNCYATKYRKHFHHPMMICNICNTMKEHHAKGLCANCYDRYKKGEKKYKNLYNKKHPNHWKKGYKRPIARCNICDELKEHFAKGLCQNCYKKYLRMEKRGVKARCSKCNKLKIGYINEICYNCYKKFFTKLIEG